MDDTNLSIVKVDNIKKFWLSFTTWFEDELPGTGILKAYYEDYDNWNGGIYYLGIDFEKEYRLHYGIDYSDILKLEVPQMEDIKMFIELAFHEWVIFEKRYDFTVMVNKRLSRFSIPYRLQNGRLIQEGYKTSYYLDKIIYAFLTIFLYLLKCPQSLILSALRAFCFCGKPHISRSIFLYFRYQTWLKSW